MVENFTMPTVDNVSRASRSQPHENDRGNVHVCKHGDTLWDIAREHGVSLSALQKANPQLAGRGIFTGTHVTIPAKAQPTSAHATTHAATHHHEVPAPARRAASAEQQRESRRGAAANDDEVRRRVNAHQAHVAHEAHVHHVARTARTTAAPTTAGHVGPGGKVDVKPTAHMTEAQKFDFYKGVIQSSGGKFHTQPNARNIVGLRHETNAHANGGNGRADYKFVMLWQDKNGRKHVKEFTGTTEGSDNVRRGFSDDVNHDGSRDLGRIPLGHYEYTVGHSDRLGRVLRPTRSFQVERDFNHDGKFEGRKELHADTSNAFLFHAGTSAGCQTMDAATFNNFWRSLNSSGSPSKIGYTLVEV
jgi:LysM repeat protein